MGARRIAGITVEIGGDTTKLTTALKDVDKALSTTQSSLRDVNKLLKLDPGNTELLAQKHRLLGEAVSETKEKLATLKTAAEQANQALANGEITQSQYDTLQREMLVSLQTGEIIALAFSNGKRHDFQLFKDSHVHVKAETVLEADTGYQGIAQIHANSLLPKKRSKNHPLSKQERKDNRRISRERILVEHAIRFVKRFRILSERYRNRRHRFALRFSLIAGICNFDRFS